MLNRRAAAFSSSEVHLNALLLNSVSSSAGVTALLLIVSYSAVAVARPPTLLILQNPALLLGFSLVVHSNVLTGLSLAI